MPGAVPSLNLPKKSIPLSSNDTKPRQSSALVIQKKAQAALLSPSPVQAKCYKTFEDFVSRTKLLKLQAVKC